MAAKPGPTSSSRATQGAGYRNFAQRRAALLASSAGHEHARRPRRVRARTRENIEADPRARRPMLSHVARINVRWRPPTGRSAAFDIRYAEFES
jgi:hypothetical protein